VYNFHYPVTLGNFALQHLEEQNKFCAVYLSFQVGFFAPFPI